MKPLVLLFLVCMTGMAAAPVLAAGEYMGGDIQIGGSGPYTIRVTDITTAITQPMQPVQPVPPVPTGSLSVATTPAGALVFVDGSQRGISPVTISGLAAGSHTLLLRLDGYQDLSAPVTITAGGTQTFTTSLSQAPAPAGTTSAPAQNKTPGFEAIPGIAALGAVFLVRRYC